MKRIFRTFIYSLFTLWLTPILIPAFKVNGDWQTLIIAGLVLSFITLFIKPILKILFLPINILSLGLLSWIINVIVLYLVTLVMPQITVSSWNFTGFSYNGFIVPGYNFNSYLSFILISFAVSLILGLLDWLSD